MSHQQIPPPSENLSLQPDKDTKKGLPPDYAADGSAGHRVLHINLGFFKYGTNDKAHAASIMLSLLLFVAIISVIVIGMFTSNMTWAEKAFNWLGSAFLFTTGIALGSKNDNCKKHQKTDEYS